MSRSRIPVVLAIAAAVACHRGGTGSPPASFEGRAAELVEDLGAGRFVDVHAEFDVTMRANLNVDALASHWSTYQEVVGAYEDHGAPERVERGDLVIERVPITTARGTGEVRVTYHPDGTIAGLYFLEAGAPAP